MKTVPCELCGTPTNYTGTKQCNRCWELERRIECDPELAKKILERLNEATTGSALGSTTAPTDPISASQDAQS